MSKFRLEDEVEEIGTHPAKRGIVRKIENDFWFYVDWGRWNLDPCLASNLKLISKGKEMKKELKKPVAHWEFLIKWVENRVNLHEKPLMGEMYDSIGEAWSATDCLLCDTHRRGLNLDCSSCPAYVNESCCDGYWGKMADADTWAEWLVNAYKLLDVLREIEKEEEEAKRKSEVTYKIGQRFSHWAGIFQLTRLQNNKIILIGIKGQDSGKSYGYKGYLVENQNSITKSELKRICVDGDFTLIEGK